MGPPPGHELTLAPPRPHQETHPEPPADHPTAAVEGQPGDRPRSLIPEGAARAGPVSPDHLLLPCPDPHTPATGKPAFTGETLAPLQGPAGSWNIFPLSVPFSLSYSLSELGGSCKLAFVFCLVCPTALPSRSAPASPPLSKLQSLSKP